MFCVVWGSVEEVEVREDQFGCSLEKVVCLGGRSVEKLMNCGLTSKALGRSTPATRCALRSSLRSSLQCLRRRESKALPSPRLRRGRRGSSNALALSVHQVGGWLGLGWSVPLARPDARTTNSEPVRCSFLARPFGTPASSAVSVLILRTGNRLEAGHSGGLAGRA
jgi:hypothetical protein